MTERVKKNYLVTFQVFKGYILLRAHSPYLIYKFMFISKFHCNNKDLRLYNIMLFITYIKSVLPIDQIVITLNIKMVHIIGG